MMNFLVRLTLAWFLGTMLLASAARSAPPSTISGSVAICDPWSPSHCAVPDSSGNIPVTGTFSATLGGFAPATTGTPISVTNLGVTGTLPAGAVVVATNVGTTNAAYCKLGASATTSDQYISPGGGWFAFTVGANTQLTCITSTSTTTVNMTGGAGLPTGTGGGGGGSGGAVTMASGAVSSGAYSSGSIATGAIAAGALATGAGVDGWDLTQGAKADSACGTATGTCSLISLIKYLNTSVNAAIPAGTNLIGDVNLRQGGSVLSTTNGAYFNQLQGNAVLSQTNPSWTRASDGTRAAILDPCETNVQTYAPISITTATTTRIVAPSASNKTYICSLFLTSAAADNVGIVEGTGGTCGVGTAGVVGGTTATNGLNFAANGGVMLQAGGKTAVAYTAGTNVDLCLITSAATPLAGGIKYVQAP